MCRARACEGTRGFASGFYASCSAHAMCVWWQAISGVGGLDNGVHLAAVGLLLHVADVSHLVSRQPPPQTFFPPFFYHPHAYCTCDELILMRVHNS